MNKDLIYFDAQTKSLLSSTSKPEQLTFNDIRNTDIIAKPEEYKMSIVRFQADTSLLPIIIPQIQPNQANPNLTVYTVRMDFGGQAVETPVIWRPEILSVPVPPAPNTLPFGLQQETPYYYALNYQHFIEIINEALLTCMTALKALTTPTNDSVLPPFMGWNTETLCAEMLVSPLMETRPIRLFFNKALYALFSSFEATTFANDTALGEIYRLRLDSNNLYNVEVNYKGSAVNKIVLKQNYSTISSWSPVSAIVFTSNSLPVVSNYVSAPQISLESQAYPISGGNNQVNIITDICTLENSYKPTIIYNPSAQYRYIDLYGASPIKNIEVQCFWRSTSGNYIPLLVSSGGSASLKILFEKK